MPTTPPLPLLKRVPPGLWTALVWFAAAGQPVVEYVLLPSQQAYSLNYPRDGLDSLQARSLLALAFVLALVGCVLLGRSAVPAYGLIVAATVVSTAAWRQDEIPPLQFLGVNAALCHVAATRSRRTSLAASAGALGVLACYLVLRPVTGDDSGTAPEPFVALTVVIAWLIGNSASQARAHAEELHARAAAQAVTAERLRIAREMHDTVAHSIGIIALQAGAAARVLETQPAMAREAMRTVEQAGRETLAGLRRTLGALRQAEQEGKEPERGAEPEQAPPQPAAGLVDVDTLAARAATAGVQVEVRWRGRRRPLPADVELAAFRVIQESVTNVLRHSGADTCLVSVDYREKELALEIADPGKGGSGNTGTDAGYGLVGMRERVSLLHGAFSAGPRPGHGFLVTVRLPLPAEPCPATEAKAATR